MPLHLFPTPVECKSCGTVVDDPSSDHCPACGELLTERRTPSRLAGVERKYEKFRLLLGLVRFLGATAAALGILAFFFADESFSTLGRGLTLLGSILIGSGFFLTAGLIEIVADLEENSRAGFRVLQSILEELRKPSSLE